mmetsp:Transcript_17353/g.51864  ORF Transcript_17353/g.51864 Transcript_17353/m.51864 type:complete len:113 (+) Transcript_17353:369-707(+)
MVAPAPKGAYGDPNDRCNPEPPGERETLTGGSLPSSVHSPVEPPLSGASSSKKERCGESVVLRRRRGSAAVGAVLEADSVPSPASNSFVPEQEGRKSIPAVFLADIFGCAAL